LGLTIQKIKTAQIGKRLHDGRGLYLTLSSPGRGKWTIRYMLRRKAKEMGLGRYPEVSLAEARKRHFEARVNIESGNDPIEKKRQSAERDRIEEAIRFSGVADDYIDEHRPQWTNAKHAYDWRASLARHAIPHLDKKPFAQLGTSDVLEVLKPIWHSKHETARKIQNRLKLIFGYAIAAGIYHGNNPAAWQDHLAHYFPILNATHLVRHHRALDYKSAPAFFAELASIDTMASKALQFTTLTAARTNETRGATRKEFDFDKMIWRVPKERMKARKLHEVPLSDQACCLVEKLIRSQNSSYLFHGRDPEKPLSNMAMLSLMKKKLQSYDTTVHGLRSSFRTWAGEKTYYNPAIIEFALAHQLDEKIEGAYLRSELVERRRPLMQDWADFLTGDLTADLTGKVSQPNIETRLLN